MKRHTIKPSKGMSRFTFFIGLLFCVFGVVFTIGSFFMPVAFFAVPFAVIWTSIAVFNTSRAYKNGFTEEGVPMYEIESVEEKDEIDFEDKLRSLERLKQDGLISEEEYSVKREQIMSREW